MSIASSDIPLHAPDTPAVLLERAHAVSSTLDLKELLKIIAQLTAAACGADVCSIFLWSPSGDRLVPMMSQTASGQQMDALREEFKRIVSHNREGTLPIITAIGQRTPIVMNDPATSPLLPSRWVEQFQLKALLSMPLIRHDVVIGTLVRHQMIDRKRFTEARSLDRQEPCGASGRIYLGQESGRPREHVCVYPAPAAPGADPCNDNPR
jgi:GAF domain-containing protein